MTLEETLKDRHETHGDFMVEAVLYERLYQPIEDYEGILHYKRSLPSPLTIICTPKGVLTIFVPLKIICAPIL